MANSFDSLKLLSKRSLHVFDIIQKMGPLTNSELGFMTKMKKSTLSRSMDDLINSGLIAERASGESTGGRKPIIFDVNPKLYYLIGIDISRTYLQLVITNMKMETIAQKIYYNEFSEEMLMVVIEETINNFLAEICIDMSSVIGIGVGTVFVEDSINNLCEESRKLKAKLEDKFKVPVYIDNGVNAAVIGEYYFGCGKGKTSVSYINCGVGIRSGIISKGSLIRNRGIYDPLGHMIVQIDGKGCSCGRFGCVQEYSSVVSIKNDYISEIKKGRTSKYSKDLDKLSYLEVCNLAEEGDELSIDVIKEAAVYFGTALANYINLLGPEVVILNGPLIKNSPLFYETSKNTALNKVFLSSNNKIKFSKEGYFKNKAMAIGAAYFVMHELITSEL